MQESVVFHVWQIPQKAQTNKIHSDPEKIRLQHPILRGIGKD